MDYYDNIGQAPLWEGGQTVLGLEGGGIHMKLVNSKYECLPPITHKLNMPTRWTFGCMFKSDTKKQAKKIHK